MRMRASGITTAALIVAAGTASATAATGQLSPSEIRATFGTGKPFSAVSAGGQTAYWFTFNTDGSALAVRKGQSAVANGKWRLSNDGYCWRWGTGAEQCYTVDKNGDQFDVRDASGAVIAYLSLATPPAAGAAGSAKGQYADGTYTGPVVDAYYGLMQVQAIINGGRLTSIKVLRYPNDRSTSIYINRQALPMLRDEVIQAQSANVDIISGATLSSEAFIRSLGVAMRQAGS
jgi:uncharacterized protein with FMN-binding domain